MLLHSTHIIIHIHRCQEEIIAVVVTNLRNLALPQEGNQALQENVLLNVELELKAMIQTKFISLAYLEVIQSKKLSR